MRNEPPDKWDQWLNILGNIVVPLVILGLLIMFLGSLG